MSPVLKVSCRTVNILLRICTFKKIKIFSAGGGGIWLLGWSSEVECNIKMSISFFDDLGGLLSHFGWLSLLGRSSEFVHNPKMSISFFDDLGGLFLHFGHLMLLGSLGWSSEVERNIKMSFSFFLWLRGAFFTFQLTFITQMTQPIIIAYHKWAALPGGEEDNCPHCLTILGR